MAEQKVFLRGVPEHMARVVAASPQTRAIMQLAYAKQLPFRIIGVAPVPAEPVFHNNMWLVPLADDRSPIPARALRRVQTIYRAGIRPKAFIVAHEAPPQLMVPRGTPKVSRAEQWAKHLPIDSATVGNVAGMVAKTVGAVVGIAGMALLAIGLAGVAVPLVALFGLVLIDPALICVTDDDVWILIDSWMA